MFRMGRLSTRRRPHQRPLGVIKKSGKYFLTEDRSRGEEVEFKQALQKDKNKH